jgi:formylglycine-generating enzyme required for sulfatase activity
LVAEAVVPDVLDLLRARALLRRGLAGPEDLVLALSGGRFLDRVSLLADLSAADRLAVEAEAQEALEGLKAPGAPAFLAPTSVGPCLATLPATNEDGAPTLDERRYGSFRPLGEGGMGVVYLALDRHMGRQVALKMIRPLGVASSADTPHSVSPPEDGSPNETTYRELEARLLVEAWVTGGLEHPGILPVYELGRTATGVPYYTMRVVRGGRTLREAIAEAHEHGDLASRLALLEPLLKACDTVGYAHAQGVVHRDLKPEHVTLGSHGETIVLDWGIARVMGSEEPAGSLISEQVEGLLQDAGTLTQAGGVLGTTGYASPEAARGDLDAISPRADVFALGVILFECLTGKSPFPRREGLAAYYAALKAVPPDAHALDRAVPEGLSAIARRAMAFERSERYENAGELGAALRAWQARSQVEREVEGWLREVRGVLAEAEAAEGEGRLRHLDRAFATLSLVERSAQAPAEVASLGERGVSLRALGMAEASRASRRRLVRRSAGVLAVLVVAASALVARTLDARRREAETERDAKGRALDEVLRLSDAKRVRDLVADADALWPVSADMAPAMAAWLERARAVIDMRGDHEAALAAVRAQALPYAEEDRAKDQAAGRAALEALDQRVAALEREVRALGDGRSEADRAALASEAWALRARREGVARAAAERATWRFAADADRWRHQVLLDVLADVDRVSAAGGLRDVVAARHEVAATLARRSLEEAAVAWSRAIEEVAASERYGGLRLERLEGLVPLGADPASGLSEFAHLGSGTVPARDATGKLVETEDTALVLVLVPGGTFWMGAQKEDPTAPNHDPEALADEAPVHRVTLSPFLLGKHEITQAQWRTMTEGEDPSAYKAGWSMGGRRLTPRNPVDQVSWEECDRWLSRHRLRLPTEAQWEYACRAGTDAPWYSGRDVQDLARVANLRDLSCKAARAGPLSWPYADVDDGHAWPAPVGTYDPNAFGLHDMIGNLWEWCQDVYLPYAPDPATDPEPGNALYRVHRSGSWLVTSSDARASCRARDVPGPRFANVGVRAAARLVTSE